MSEILMTPDRAREIAQELRDAIEDEKELEAMSFQQQQAGALVEKYGLEIAVFLESWAAKVPKEGIPHV